MEIILLKDVEDLGLAGQVVTVAAGYARNYLTPASLALPATPVNLKAMAKERAEYEQKRLKAIDIAEQLKVELDQLRIVLERKVGEKSKLYGAVTAIDITEAIKVLGFEIDRRQLRLGEPIKSLGDYQIPYRAHTDVFAMINVTVLAEVIEEDKKANPKANPKDAAKATIKDAKEKTDSKTTENTVKKGSPKGDF